MLPCRTLSCLLIAAATCAASTPFSFSNLNIAITGVNSTYYTTLTGSGTASFTGLGSASASLTGTSTRERGLNCGDYVQLAMTFSFNANDSISIGMTFPTGPSLTAAPFNVTGGTGAYNGVGGSGTVTATLSNSTIAGSGSGTLNSKPAPVASIYPSGIVPANSSVPIVQPSSWVSIYGNNLANGVSTWQGDFPTNLGGVSVTIDNKPAYLWIVTPGQINLQVPDDLIQGCVNVVVTTPNGVVNSQVTLQPQQPSFSLLTPKYVAAEIPEPDGSGGNGSGAGSYDLAGPPGAVSGAFTRPAKAGETVELFGVGFGPTAATVPAGKVPAASTTTILTPTVTIGGARAQVVYSGLIGPGLYQINVVIPKVPSGDQLIQATLPQAPNPILFSADATQSCADPDPQGSNPANCNLYITIQ